MTTAASKHVYMHINMYHVYMHVNIYRSVADVTTTACKHSFHTFCLVETLGNGMCMS